MRFCLGENVISSIVAFLNIDFCKTSLKSSLLSFFQGEITGIEDAKMEMWLEHLLCGDGEGAGPVKLEKAERRPYQCTQISEDDGARPLSVGPSHRKRGKGS